MSAPTFDEVRNELIAFQAARVAQKKDGKAETLALIGRHGCPKLGDLEKLNDPAVYERIIDEARVLAGKPPRLLPTHDAILRFIQAQKDGGCNAEERDRIYAAIAATEGLQPTEIDCLIKALKPKLPGSPSVGSIRKEMDALGRKAHSRKHPLPDGAELVIFRCHTDDTVYGGVSDPATGRFVPTLELASLKGSTGIAQLCGLFGRAPIDPQRLPLGVFEFRPGATPQVTKTAAGYEINTWTPPTVREQAVPSKIVPPTVRQLLLHVLGGDQAVYEHFLNWLAVAYQTHDRTGTAWIISGCPGTGKGILFDHIITPLFGERHSFGKMTKDLESNFNGWFAECLMLNVDEAKTAGFQATQVEAALRRYCTAPIVSVEDKNVSQRMYRNYCNVILTSNEERPISIDAGDRRYNVAPKQKVSLPSLKINTNDMVNAIRSEIPQFAGFLAAYDIDIERARRPMTTEQREILIENSTTTPERIARAIENGDLDWFLGEFWTGVQGTNLFNRSVDADDARKVLLSWAKAANPAGTKKLSYVNSPASYITAMFNFLMPDKLKRTPQEIGRALGLKATARCGPKENRGRAYRIVWKTKENVGQLAQIVDELEHFGSADEEEFEHEESLAAVSKGQDQATQGETKENSTEDTSWLDETIEPPEEPPESIATDRVKRQIQVDCESDQELAEKVSAFLRAEGLVPKTSTIDEVLWVIAEAATERQRGEIEAKLMKELGAIDTEAST